MRWGSTIKNVVNDLEVNRNLAMDCLRHDVTVTLSSEINRINTLPFSQGYLTSSIISVGFYFRRNRMRSSILLGKERKTIFPKQWTHNKNFAPYKQGTMAHNSATENSLDRKFVAYFIVWMKYFLEIFCLCALTFKAFVFPQKMKALNVNRPL